MLQSEQAVRDEQRFQEQREVVGNPRAYFPAKFKALFQPARYKSMHGGRGSGKSWAAARALVLLMGKKPLRVLCARELQNSIAESVHRLISDQIFDLGLLGKFIITEKSIRCINGGEFIFAGIRSNPMKIKSMEGLDVCWVEEASVISERSWELLTPTIRNGKVYTGRDGVREPEIWLTWNPDQMDDPTYVRFAKNLPPGCVDIVVNWTDNPFFPNVLRREKDYDYSRDPDLAAHVWGGECRVNSEAQIFKGRYIVDLFAPPDDARWYHGMDFGFANDPFALTKMYITGDEPTLQELWVYDERSGVGIELDDLPTHVRSMPTALKWPCKGDNSRPETISYLKRVVPMNLVAAEKWGGSVEDGITHMKGFRKIHVHSVNCPRGQKEFRLYHYKVDPKTEEVLPIIVDAWNHTIDADRYGLDGLIHRRGADKVWSRFAGH
jgi:phage terminase large subunit